MLDKASVLRGRPILLGGGTDGVSVNIGGQNGMKSKLQESIVRVLCLANCSRTLMKCF